MGDERFDVVIIGSGFGGAITAHRLAEAGLRVCVLERGKAWPPGSFPRAPIEMKENVWDPKHGRHGLFDVWSFRRFAAIVASGLGGGSLLYSNVLLRKGADSFVDPDGTPWPLDRATLDPHYDRVERAIDPVPYPIDSPEFAFTPKVHAFREGAEAAGMSWIAPPLAIAFSPKKGATPRSGEPIVEDVPNRFGRTRVTCRKCGECNVGCNYGSKSTLDLNYLGWAERAGAELRTLCDVRDLAPREGGGWFVRYVRYGDTTEADPPLLTLAASRVIVAAGTFGSTRLLLRSRPGIPSLGARLGERLSGNGDLLAFVWQALRDGKARPLEPTRGPVITTAIRGDRDFYLEDAGFPAFFAWLVETARTPSVVSRAARFLVRLIAGWLGIERDPNLSDALARAIGDAATTGSSLPILAMGLDAQRGVVTLDARDRLAMEWSMKGSDGFVERVREACARVAEAMGGTLRDDPLYWISRVVTVHPLGGCSMGRDADDGVVDAFGRVFGARGLYVSDGSTIRGAVGENPALTIAAFADRVAEGILDEER